MPPFVLGGLLLLAAHVGAYAVLVEARPADACTGIGFGCRPSAGLTVAFAAGITTPPWLVAVGAAIWVARRRAPRQGRWLAWGSLLVAIGAAGWLAIALAG